MNCGRSAFEHLPDGLPVAYVDRQVPVARQCGLQFIDNRMSRALLAEELPAHIVVDPDNLPAFGRELADAFRADQPAGSSDKSLHSQDPLYYRACLQRGKLARCAERRIRYIPAIRRR